MYKISLYPEYHQARQQAKKRAVRTAMFMCLIGLEILLVGSLVVSALLLEEQARVMRSGFPRLMAQVQDESGPKPELELAREMIWIRANRINWSPKLAALSERITSSLMLQQINGQTAAQNRPAQLQMDGEIRGSSTLDEVTRFIDVLRDDQRVTETFPDIRLGTIKGKGAGEFQVVCRPAGEDS